MWNYQELQVFQKLKNTLNISTLPLKFLHEKQENFGFRISNFEFWEKKIKTLEIQIPWKGHGWFRLVRVRNGFSLIETMLALSILSIGLVAITYGLQTGLKAIRLTKDYTLASFLSQAKIEELRCTRDFSKRIQKGKLEYSEFSWETKISPCKQKNLKKIEVCILFDQGRRLELTTYMIDYSFDKEKQDLCKKAYQEKALP